MILLSLSTTPLFYLSTLSYHFLLTTSILYLRLHHHWILSIRVTSITSSSDLLHLASPASSTSFTLVCFFYHWLLTFCRLCFRPAPARFALCFQLPLPPPLPPRRRRQAAAFRFWQLFAAAAGRQLAAAAFAIILFFFFYFIIIFLAASCCYYPPLPLPSASGFRFFFFHRTSPSDWLTSTLLLRQASHQLQHRFSSCNKFSLTIILFFFS